MVLLFGMPRSGTTWLGKILDSHPDTLYLHEPDSVIREKDLPRILDLADVAQYKTLLTSYVQKLTGVSSVKVRGKTPFFPKSYFPAGGYAVYRCSVLAAKVLANWVKNPPVMTPGADSAPIVIWKSIESVGRLAVLASIFPRLRAVFLLRHPCGYIASVLRGKNSGYFESDYDPARDYDFFQRLIRIDLAKRRGLTLNNLRELDPLDRLAWRWTLLNESVLTQIQGLKNCIALRYEDVCNDPLAQAKHLFSFTGLSWDTQTESFLQKSSHKESEGYYSVYRESKLAAERWREELDREQIEKILSIAAGSRGGSLYGLT